MVNAILRHASGIRVDHIIGLFRLWWIPKGLPTEGTYVRYDHEAMIGILALEAHRAEAVVVGEDLGGRAMGAGLSGPRGLLGTSILWFELDRDGDGGPLQAQRWREYCLSSVTTHDLPPTAGYLAGEHVRLRDELGLLTRPVEEELADDRAEQVAWVDELRRVGLLGEKPGVDETVLALYRYLGRTRRGCSVFRSPMRSARCAPRTSREPPTNIRTGGSPRRSRRASATARRPVHRPARRQPLRGSAGRGEVRRCNAGRVFTGFTFVTAAICSQRTDQGEVT